MLFTRNVDEALDRWTANGREYAIAADEDCPNPIEDYPANYVHVSVAPRPGTYDKALTFTRGEEKGETHEVQTDYLSDGYVRKVIVLSDDPDVAQAVADAMIFWLPGEVYRIGWESDEGESDVLHGVFGWPSRKYVEDCFK